MGNLKFLLFETFDIVLNPNNNTVDMFFGNYDYKPCTWARIASNIDATASTYLSGLLVLLPQLLLRHDIPSTTTTPSRHLERSEYTVVLKRVFKEICG